MYMSQYTMYIYTICTRPLSVQAEDSRSCPGRFIPGKKPTGKEGGWAPETRKFLTLEGNKQLLCHSYVRVFTRRTGLTDNATVAIAPGLVTTETEFMNLTEILASFKSRNFSLYFLLFWENCRNIRRLSSSGGWHPVALIRTDVSEDRIASIFRVHECEQVTERSCKLLYRHRLVED
jgi:hypothetical protein